MFKLIINVMLCHVFKLDIVLFLFISIDNDSEFVNVNLFLKHTSYMVLIFAILFWYLKYAVTTYHFSDFKNEKNEVLLLKFWPIFNVLMSI